MCQIRRDLPNDGSSVSRSCRSGLTLLRQSPSTGSQRKSGKAEVFDYEVVMSYAYEAMPFRRLRKSMRSFIAQRKSQSLRKTGEEILRVHGQSPIVIVMVDGGLCSAITKYVLGECFRKNFGMVVKYDLTWFEMNGKDCDNKGSRLFTLTTLFPHLEMEAATQEEIGFYKQHFYYNNPTPYWYDTRLLSYPRPLYFDGYAEKLEIFF